MQDGFTYPTTMSAPKQGARIPAGTDRGTLRLADAKTLKSAGWYYPNGKKFHARSKPRCCAKVDRADAPGTGRPRGDLNGGGWKRFRCWRGFRKRFGLSRPPGRGFFFFFLGRLFAGYPGQGTAIRPPATRPTNGP